MALQIFGTKKCRDTAKAMRFFKERGVRFQFVDLAEKPISPGELASVRQAVGADALVDREGQTFAARGLAYMDYDPEEEILAHPLLLKTPVVRDGRKATIGLDPAGWARMAQA
jgi:arsenate reductase-like glutaredoxin family protein